jgi:hypothetical protein
MGQAVGLLECALFAGALQFIALVALTPASLGIRELLLGVLVVVTGMSFQQGIFAAALDRVVATAGIVMAGTPSLLWLGHRHVLGAALHEAPLDEAEGPHVEPPSVEE